MSHITGPCSRRLRLPSPALAALGLSILGALSVACGPPGEDVPNVLLVTLDTTRADYFGVYGHPEQPTPNFDSLARSGVTFDVALSTAAVTPVSHASILTGRYPYTHDVRVLSAASGFRVPADLPSLAPWLQERGWRTGAVHSAFPVSSHFGFGRGFDHFDAVEGEMSEAEGRHRWDVQRFQRRSDETTRRALEFVDAGNEPFFLWIHYWDPHDDVLLPPEEFLEGVPPGGRSLAQYTAEVRYLDHQFGRLMSGLEERGLKDTTLVAVTADHGEGLMEHGWLQHRLLYQEQLHVPLIVSVPGGPTDRRVPGIVSTVDLAPTLLDYLGLAPLPDIDGRSLRESMEGAPLEPRTVYADQINGYDLNSRLSLRRPKDDFLYAVVQDPWKLVYHPAHPDAHELYHLRDDPDEAHNRFAVEPAVRRELLLELARRRPWVSAPFAGGDDGPGAETREALAALGYAPADEKPSLAAVWSWVCVDHPDEVADEELDCPVCAEPRLMRARASGGG